MISLLLAGWLSAPSYGVRSNLNEGQVRRRAHQIVQLLRRQDPRVLRSVMYYMKWVPKIEYKKGKMQEPCKKDKRKSWELNMLLDMAGIPRKKK